MALSGEQRSKWRRFSRWLNIVALIALIVGAVAPYGASAALPVGRAAGEEAARNRPASVDADSLVVNGSFSADLAGWSYTGSIYVSPGANEYMLVFNGGSNPSGSQIWQQISTEAGKPYALTYQLMHYTGGWPSQTFLSQALVEVIDVGTNQVLASATSVAEYQWPVGFSLPFVAQGPATIRFTDTSTGTSGQDLFMDNVAVTLANQAPTAVNDNYNAAYQTVLTIAAPGVLANDTDPDSNPLTAVKVTDPVHGALTLNADGSFTYTPATGYTGADSFTYHANDGIVDSNNATVNITVAAPPCATQPADLVSWWRAESNASDALSGNHGALQNGATYAAGEVGQAFSFNGVDQHVRVPSSANLEMRNNLTVMAWFKVNHVGDDASAKVFSKRTAANFGPYEVDIRNNGGSIVIQSQYSIDGAAWGAIPAAQPIATGQWHHVAFVVDGSNRHTFYLDGQSQGSTQLGAQLMAHAGAPLLFGTDDRNAFPLDGLVDEVQIAGRALSAAEIQGIHDAGISGVCAPANTAPTAADDSYETPFETELVVEAPGVLTNDTDPENDPLTAVKVADPAHGTVTLEANGAFTYRATTGYSGPDSFTYRANDGAHNSNVATVSLSVRASEGDAGLLGYWKFDDGAGATALDASDYQRNGTLAGGATWSADTAPITNYNNPGSISMSGSTGLVTVPNSAINKLTNNFTVMGWIKPSSIGPVQRFISSALTTTSGNGWGFGLNSSWLYFTTYGVKSYLTPTSTGMKAGQWHHVAAVMDSSNAVTFYVDGIPAGTVPHTAPGIADMDDALLIGARTNSGSTTPTEAFNGQIDDVRVFNRALSAVEVADQVGTSPCSETVFRARTMLGEASASKTITLDGACTYTLTTVGDPWNGGNGVYLRYATAIEGNGATIERAPTAPQMRIMTLSQAITIQNLTLRGGDVLAGGGSIYAWGKLTLNNVRFENNTINHATGSPYVNVGGAVYAVADLVADRAVFVNNQADGYGGAIYARGTTTTIENSIFANNLSALPGAAINAANASGSLTLLNNTFSNQYKSANEAVLINGAGTIKSNIFDNFAVGLTVSGSSATANEDYNLFSRVDVPTRIFNGGSLTTDDHDRTAASARFVDPVGLDYRLQSNSPAIDFGADAGAPTDAAGNPRPATSGTAVDIGAYEYQGVGVPSISITKTGPPYISTGAQFRFTLTVINEGSDSLNDLRVVDPLPAGATYVAGSASNGGVLSGGSLTWDVGLIAGGQSKRFEYRVTATQTLVSDGYSVSSISNPAIAATGPALTTPFDVNARASGFFPYPDGYSFPNYGDVVEASDVTVDDMIKIYGLAVCKTQDPCVLTATAEAVRKAKATSSTGGHCAGMAAASMEIFDDATTDLSAFQAGATYTFDLTKANARNLIAIYMSTQGDSPANTADLPSNANIQGATAIVDALKANYADPNPADRYLLSLYDINGGSGHRVTPYAVVQQTDPDQYWIYAYDNNFPNNYNRVFKVTYSTGAWIYEGGATHPSAPLSDYRDDGSQPNHLILRSYRWVDAFPKKCTTACAPPTFSKLNPAHAATGVATNPTLSWEVADSATEYHYCYDTTNDNSCSSWYNAGAATSKTLSGLAANTTYYWHIRAKNSYGYTYANGGSTAYWSFTTAAPGMAPTQTFAPAHVAEVLPPIYEFQLEGEGRLMITRSDGKRAGIDPLTGVFVTEIPGAEEVPYEGGSGLDIPSVIRILHETGMTYTLRVADTHNAYGNSSATADLNIFGPGTMTRLTGLKIDSPVDPEAPAGSNDVMGVTFDPESHSLSFQSSSLDSDTPTLGMAISQSGLPDFTFSIGGAQMPSGNTINVAFDPATGKLTVTNDDPSSNNYSYEVERINLDGSKTSYSGTTGDGAGQGVSLDLGPNWTGGAPTSEEVRATLGLQTTTPTFCIQDNATIDLHLADAVGLYGYQVDVSYDSSKVYASGAFDNGWFDTTMNAAVPGGYNAACSGGVCRFGASKVAPATPLSGSGRLGALTLTGHTAGTFNLTITSSLLSDIDGLPIVHDVVSLPLTICDLATVSGKISMQGRATPINVGAVTLTDPTGTFGPYTVDFSATDGTWTVSGVRAAWGGTTYTIQADHGLYLFNTKALTVQPSTSYADQNTRLWGGDANNDERITIGDLSCIGGAFGSWAPCGADGGSDINADGTTNILDLSIAGGNYGKQSPQDW